MEQNVMVWNFLVRTEKVSNFRAFWGLDFQIRDAQYVSCTHEYLLCAQPFARFWEQRNNPHIVGSIRAPQLVS